MILCSDSLSDGMLLNIATRSILFKYLKMQHILHSGQYLLQEFRALWKVNAFNHQQAVFTARERSLGQCFTTRNEVAAR